LQIRALKNHYQKTYDPDMENGPMDFSDLSAGSGAYGDKFARMKIGNDKIVGSVFGHGSDEQMSRQNYNVAIKVMQDAHQSNRNVRSHFVEIDEEFAEVQYYLLHTFRGRIHMLAFVLWTSPALISPQYGYKYFEKMGTTFQIQDAYSIDRTVAFWKRSARKTIIIDKEFTMGRESMRDSVDL